MSWLKRERLKLYILLILVITSFIQVGILWNYQNQGEPTNFLLGIFYGKNKEISVDIGNHFEPYRIVISEGFENPHWIVSEKQKYYDELWEDAKSYLSNILTGKNVIMEQEYTEEFWGEVVLKKSFIFEFKTKISNNLLSAFLKLGSPSNLKLGGIYKMAILPSENINNNVSLYIYDGTRVAKYVVPFNFEGLTRDNYDGIISEFYSKEIEGYSVIKEHRLNINKLSYNLRPDVLIVLEGNKYRSFNNIILDTPDYIDRINPNRRTDLEKIAEDILGREKEDYIRAVDMYNVIVFQNLSNMYKIYRDGLLEYKYLSVIGKTDKGNESEAFEKALKFIKERDSLISGIDVYLTGIIDQGDYYTFTFDYRFDGMPITFDKYTVMDKDKKSLNNAITIDANSKRVLSCYWILKEIEKGSEELQLNVNFEALLNDAFSKYIELNNSFSIKDLYISYKVKSNLSSQNLKPVWVIEALDDKRYIVPMREKP
ncbi:MAG: hypothetical protein ACOYWZ_19805 [Bacillota bacterium]